MKYRDEELQKLLARGRLGGPARERVLERVLTEVAPPRRKGRAWLVPLALALSSGVAVLVVMARPRPDDGWGTKGGPGGSAVTLEGRCGESGPCHPGATLMFSVFGSSRAGFLGAYAEPVGGGERLWYFSAETGSPPVPASDQATRPAGQGILIGPEHRPGDYQVHLFLTASPLPQAVLLAGGDPRILARAVVPVTVASP
jgi:hypothetical protein